MPQDNPNLSHERLIGQLFMVGFHGTTPSAEIRALIAERHVGGVILFSRNIADTPQLAVLTRALQRIARDAGHPAPLLIATDQENGLVRRLGAGSTIFPGNMALGAVDDEATTGQVAAATGAELRALGVNMNLAPDADINNNPANPVIGVRSFGEDPQAVARHVAAAVEGYRAARVIPTLKHFPGHGDTAVDSHLAMPALPYSLDRLERVELVPFARGIAAGADAVMTAHLALPRELTGDALPATLSPWVLRQLLRERLGFQGVTITDCLEMNAISEGVGVPRGAVLALAAGADLVLVSHRHDRHHAALDAALAAASAGTLDLSALQQAAARVLDLKRRFLTWDEATGEADLHTVGSAPHQRLSAETYVRAITLVRDTPGLLPLRLPPEARVLVVAQPGTAVSQAVDVPYSHAYLAEQIARRHTNITALCLPATPEESERALLEAQLDAAVRAADLLVIATINAHLDPPQAALVRALLATGKPAIGLVLADPYDLGLFPTLGTTLASYEYSPPALAVAAAALFGERPLSGKLPVTISGLAGA
jgi:beta-N-acetylhexosaminidase